MVVWLSSAVDANCFSASYIFSVPVEYLVYDMLRLKFSLRLFRSVFIDFLRNYAGFFVKFYTMKQYLFLMILYKSSDLDK